MKHDVCATRAEEFETLVEDCLVDEHGAVRSDINACTMKPFPQGFFDESKDFLRYPDACYADYADFVEYEDSGIATGAYLCAQIWKYRATKDPAALTRARRCFEGLKAIFDMSQSVEEGYFCKPYGWKVTDQVSCDQYIFAMAGFNEFMHYASFAERQVCIDMIGKMMRWWMRRNYSYPYYGKPLAWPIERFPGFAWMAYHHTGETMFCTEFERLSALPDVQAKLPFGRDWDREIVTEAQTRALVCDIERQSTRRILLARAEDVQFGLMSLQAPLEYVAPHRRLWLDQARRLYETSVRVIGRDGLGINPIWLDIATGELQEIREAFFTDNVDPQWRFPSFMCFKKSGTAAAMFARAAVALDRYLPSHHTLSAAASVLRQMDQGRLRWYIDVNSALPPDMKWYGECFSGNAITHWLWAYWEGCAKYGMNWCALGSSNRA